MLLIVAATDRRSSFFFLFEDHIADGSSQSVRDVLHQPAELTDGCDRHPAVIREALQGLLPL